MKNPVFKWSGEYAGFIYNGYLFDRDSNYLGWIEKDGRVWKADGQFLGELVDNNYILRSEMQIEPVSRIPRVEPVSPISPVSPIDRVGRIDRVGYADSIDWLK